ncbi:MAG: NAD(P)/FAD-dependent oxidoreductase, partial [Pseudomonadales bacterium]
AVKILQQRIEKYDIECDFKWGYCTVAYDKKRLAMLEEAQAYLKARRYPFQTHLLEGQALHSVVVSDRYVGGLLDQGSAHLNPLKLVQGEARAAQSAGVRIFSNTPVRGVEKGSQVVVRTANGTVRADKLVYACNAYLEGLDSYLQRHFVTTNAFSIATKALPESLIREILPGGAAVCDNRPVIDYYRISADNRLLFGGATHYLEYLPGDLAAHLRRNLRKVFPQLADVEIEYSWSGKMAIGANLFPQVGMLPGTDNIYYAQAYAGFGLGPSHLVARALRQQILGEKGEYEVLAAIKHPKIMASQRLNPLWVSAGKCWHQLHSLLP